MKVKKKRRRRLIRAKFCCECGLYFRLPEHCPKPDCCHYCWLKRRRLSAEFADIKLDKLEVVATLGVGGFGRVELVTVGGDKAKGTFALKCLKKQHIVETQQQEHVFSEKRIMMGCNHQFIAK